MTVHEQRRLYRRGRQQYDAACVRRGLRHGSGWQASAGWGNPSPSKPQIRLCCNALLTPRPMGLDKRRAWPLSGAAGRQFRPPFRGHNALIWINLDTVGSRCTQARPATGLDDSRWDAHRGRPVEGNTIMAIFDVARRLRASALAGAAVLLAVTLPFAGEAAAQGAVRSVHGDWQIRCETPPGAQNEQCALMQSVTAEDRPNLGLVVIVLKTSDQKNRLMRVVAPLGVLIPSGLGLKIDNNDVGRAGFVRCLPNGCVAEVVMDDKLIEQMRTGQTSTFIIFQTPEEGIGFPMSLKGFGEGFDKLP